MPHSGNKSARRALAQLIAEMHVRHRQPAFGAVKERQPRVQDGVFPVHERARGSERRPLAGCRHVPASTRSTPALTISARRPPLPRRAFSAPGPNDWSIQ